MGSTVGRVALGAMTGGLSETKLGTRVGQALGLTDAPKGDTSGIDQALADAEQRKARWSQILEQQLGETAQAGQPVQSAMSLLQAAAQGQAPSQAQAILQQGLDQSIAAQSAVANAGTMGTQLARQRAAADQGAMLTQQTANEAAMLRAQEMEAARSGFGNLAQGILAQRLGAQGTTMGGISGLSGQAIQGQQAKFGIETSAEQAQADRLNRTIGAIGSGIATGGMSAAAPGQGKGGMG